MHRAIAWTSYYALTQTSVLHTQALGPSAVNHCMWGTCVVDIIQTCIEALMHIYILSCIAVNVWKQSHWTMTSRHLIVSFVILGEDLSSVTWPADDCNLYLAHFWVAAQGPSLEVSQGTIEQCASVCSQQDPDP